MLGAVPGVNGATDEVFVGIGTTSPGYTLDIARIYDFGETVRIKQTSNTTRGVELWAERQRVGGVRDGDSLLSIIAGDPQRVLSGSARIDFQATEDVSPVNAGARISFKVRENAGNSTISALIINHNGNVGVGSGVPQEKFQVSDNAASLLVGGGGCASGSITIGLNGALGNCANYSILGDGLTLFLNRPTGGQIVFRENNGPTQLRLRSGGVLQLETLGTAGATPLCHNAVKDISTCSSSIRYKTNVNYFRSSLDLIRKLRPVSFNWTVGGMADIGLVAEEVAEIEPLLTTTNDKGEIEGVKYDRVGVVLVNAVNEQQQLIETLQKTVLEQKHAIEELRKIVCSMRPEDRACRPDRREPHEHLLGD